VSVGAQKMLKLAKFNNYAPYRGGLCQGYELDPTGFFFFLFNIRLIKVQFNPKTWNCIGFDYIIHRLRKKRIIKIRDQIMILSNGTLVHIMPELAFFLFFIFIFSLDNARCGF
jgi:hypothetical protein